MSDERDDDDDGGDVWKNPPEGVREMLRAARERPPMTREEEDRAIARAQRGLAEMRRKEQRRRILSRVSGVTLGLGLAAAVMILVVTRKDEPDPGGRRAGAPVMDLDAMDGADAGSAETPDAGPSRRRLRRGVDPGR